MTGDTADDFSSSRGVVGERRTLLDNVRECKTPVSEIMSGVSRTKLWHSHALVQSVALLLHWWEDITRAGIRMEVVAGYVPRTIVNYIITHIQMLALSGSAKIESTLNPTNGDIVPRVPLKGNSSRWQWREVRIMFSTAYGERDLCAQVMKRPSSS
jgi:hypothetical protein